ncbi:Uncharacterised protein [Klebsiella quasipneumoniae]|nr:Uncharacterised protein [Klebsiella quasipneumoniae]
MKIKISYKGSEFAQAISSMMTALIITHFTDNFWWLFLVAVLYGLSVEKE